MHEPMIRILHVTGVSILVGTPAQSIGPLIVAVVGLVLLALFLHSLIFGTVAEGGASLDRRAVTAPRPTEALQCRVTAAPLASYRRGS